MLLKVLLGIALAGIVGGCARPSGVADDATRAVIAQPDDLTGGWNSIEPGGDTVCSDGSPYRFFARDGDPARLLVYFQGGGACWFAENCDVHLEPSYKVNVAEDDPGRYDGIFALNNPENPFRDHSIVIAPYCTADVHLGDREAIYSAPAADTHEAHDLTIHHRGFENSNAVLDWVYARFKAPAEIFVTGSSAGSIPSPYYAWQIADHYPQARVAQLGDASGGYRRSATTNTDRLERWGTLEYLAQHHPEFATVEAATFTYELLYIKAAQARPDILFTEYDAAEDQVQKRFLAMGGSDAQSLEALLIANQNDIRAAVPNFRSYIGAGDSHTILGRPEFYTSSASGVRIRDWVADIAAYRPVKDVHCEPCGSPAQVADD